MTAQARQRPSTLWRILTTPVGPRILPQIDFGPAPRTVIASAGLPVPVAAVIATVVRRTRLWRSERADVARELCSHFTEGLAARRSPQELIDAFGDPRAAAAMIRRAKLRSRHVVWRAMRRLRQVLIAVILIVLLLYAWLALRFYTARPLIDHNYAADLNAPALAVPESDRAWPVYLRAAKARKPTPPSLHSTWGIISPDDPRWPDLIRNVGENRERLDLIHEAARRPRLGYVLREHYDEELQSTYGLRVISSPPSPTPELLSLNLQYLHELERAANLLLREACVAGADGRADQVVRDIHDIVAIAEHLREAEIVPGQLASLAAFGQALDTTAMVVHRYPGLLPAEDLAVIAHRLASYAGGGAIRLRLDDERVFVEDVAQRLYAPDGRFTPAGKRLLRQRAGNSALQASAVESMAFILDTATVVPSREEFIGAYARALDRAREEAATPLYLRPGRALLDPIFPPPRPYSFYVLPTAYSPDFFFPALAGANLAAEQATQCRDAVLAALALELFKRKHGRYPESLAALVPGLLPAVPLDHYDGGSLKYLLREGRPVLYVVGADRDDDGGRAPSGPDPRPVSDWLAPATLALFASGPLGANYDGDWILWPPAPAAPEPAP